MKPLSYFITGTDTEIGKTTLSCTLIRNLASKGLRVAAMKPVAAGASQVDGVWHNEDVDALMAASNMTLPVSLVSPFLLKTPIAPHLSAGLDGQVIDLRQTISFRVPRPKYSSISRPLMVILPVPGTKRTLATELFLLPVP